MSAEEGSGQADPVIVRRQRKAAITRRLGAIQRSVALGKQAEVADRLSQLETAFSEFEAAHDVYHESLSDIASIDESEKWYQEVENNYIEGVTSARAYLLKVGFLNENNDTKSDVKVKQEIESDIGSVCSQSDSISYKCFMDMMHLPRVEIDVFDGNPLKYQSFTAIFDEIVDKKIDDDHNKLTRLLQYTSGQAKAAIQGCAVTGGSKGYQQAREILQNRFGDPHLVSRRIINDIKCGKPVNKPDELQQLADDLRMAQTALEGLHMLSEIDNQRSILDVLSRCKQYVSNKWKRKALEYKRQHSMYPDFPKFVAFVSEMAAEACDPVYGGDPPKVTQHAGSGSHKAAPHGRALALNTTSQTPVRPCVACGQGHKLHVCDGFKKLSISERFSLVKQNRLCFNCLQYGHNARVCKCNITCRIQGCGLKHNTLIHKDPSGGGSDSSGGVAADVTANMHHGFSSVCLPVVPVVINGEHEAFALLDSGSTNTFLTQRVASKLGLVGKNISYRLNTLGNSTNVRTKVVSFNIVVPDSNEVINMESVIVVPQIPVTNTGKRVDVKDFASLADLPIRPINDKTPVDVIIGLDNAGLIAPIEVRHANGDINGLYATRTRLGWALNGPVNNDDKADVSAFHVSLEQQIENLWKLEADHDDVDGLSCDDKRVLGLWENEIKREDGHYVLPIPWKNDKPHFPNNKHVAMHRLRSTENKIERMSIRSKYDENVMKMLTEGYAERVPGDELTLSDGSVWYLPHHAVLSESKPGKVRVVFDCAAKVSGTSLNTQCFQGPDLNNKLVDVLLRFRQYPYAVTGDVEAMYYQVRVPEKQRNSLRFLWSVNGSVQEFRMTSHVFGGVWCSSSSTFALRRAAHDSGANGFVRNLINKDFYVDDLLCSTPTREEAREAIFGTKDALVYGGFNLTKFITNDPILFDEIPGDDRAGGVKEIAPDLNTKALGVRWDVRGDAFYYVSKQVAAIDNDGLVTRRKMLSEVSSMYDPLGLISPVVIKGRMLFQEATRLKLAWDDPVPVGLCNGWISWLNDLHNLPSLQFDRCLIPSEFVDGVTELHHFCDASLSGYGACCYVRSINKSGQVYVALVASKGRLAPIKAVTIPRLELCACVEAVKLDRVIRNALDIELMPSTFWSDSEIALAYIKNEERRFKVFVSNRVSIIRERSEPSQWKHISGEQNPADIVSRGSDSLSLSGIWKQGPDFLMAYKDRWPQPCISNVCVNDDPEVIRQTMACSTAIDVVRSENPLDCMIEYYSSFYRLCKAVCWWLRVKSGLKGKIKTTGRLTASELSAARKIVLCHVQATTYASEMKSLSQNGHVAKGSSISKLNPIMKDGLMVVGGRLSNAVLSETTKWPVILPRDHKVCRMIVRECHEGSHVGTEWTLSLIRKRYWIIGARSLIKGVGRNCAICKRLYAAPAEQKMADLPAERLQPGNAPFYYVGMDIFGPFLVKQGRSELKRYGCVFTCFTTRAVHIEKLVSLETDAFINGFMRFVARRGCPVKVWSDNGTNLVGAKAELAKSLKDLDRNKLIQATRRMMVEWVFNPPHASHHGGVWERMIRTIRKILIALLSHDSRLTDDGLNTLFCEVESIVNGRPITKVSDDVEDLAALSPNDLLLIRGNPSLTWGEFSLADIYKKQWRHVQFVAEQFWKRWVRQYLPHLQSRHKWVREKPNIKVGDVVLMIDELAPRGNWPMALVLKTNVGRDGLVRSCTVRTKSSEFVRPVTKLVLLEGVD